MLPLNTLMLNNHQASYITETRLYKSWEFWLSNERVVIVDSYAHPDIAGLFNVYVAEPGAAATPIGRRSQADIQEILDNDGGWN